MLEQSLGTQVGIKLAGAVDASAERPGNQLVHDELGPLRKGLVAEGGAEARIGTDEQQFVPAIRSGMLENFTQFLLETALPV